MGFLSKLRRAFIQEERLSTPVKSPFLEARLKKAVAALSKVVVPGYDVDIVSSGVVARIRIGLEGSRIAVYIDYSGSNPGCSFCRFINDNLWRKILGDAKRRLEEEGFREIYFLDAITHKPVVVI